MNRNHARILLAEDDPFQVELVEAILGSSASMSFSCANADNLKEVENKLAEQEFDLILLDLNLPDSKGMDTVRKVRKFSPYLPIVVLSGTEDENVAIQAVQSGAQDYLIKGKADLNALPRVIRYALERAGIMKELERAKNEAEEATKLKDKFVSLVAHDLKSPFNSILGFLTMIHDDEKNPVHEEHKKMISRAMESGKRLVQMIEELLKISRLQTGRVVLEKRFFDGYFISLEVAAILKNLAKKKEITIVNELARDFRLYGDPSLFREVIQNLVSNAIKFCRKGDAITIFAPPGEQATIAVKDTGVGISPKMLGKIFNHEEVTSTMGTAGEKGTGFGLPISHDIMKLHGGDLRVESVEGKGSVFHAVLPFVRPKVLIIDDSKKACDEIKGFLSELKLGFLEAGSGEKAIEIMDAAPPHLFILDIYLPGMDGFQVLEHIRKNQATKSTPVIVVTGDDNIEIRDKAFRLGANDFVMKPFKMEDLVPRVRRFIH
ncbi:MAG: response regulator [Nitrospinae bacterium]|nr:response regulator [Nitrospinota bacterium]